MWLCRAGQTSKAGVGILVRGLKSDLNIKWVRPERPWCVATGPDGSGDMQLVKNPSPTEIALPYAKSESLAEANDLVKYMFSIDVQGTYEKHRLIIKHYLDLVKAHEHDKSSDEVKIATLTAKIRYFQEHLEIYPLHKHIRIRCKELIDKRKSFLKLLRQRDYKKYEWVLEKLDLVYKAPAEDRLEPVTRKKSLTKLTHLHCDAIKVKKMEEYKLSLIEKKKKLLKEYAENPV